MLTSAETIVAGMMVTTNAAAMNGSRIAGSIMPEGAQAQPSGAFLQRKPDAAQHQDDARDATH